MGRWIGLIAENEKLNVQTYTGRTSISNLFHQDSRRKHHRNEGRKNVGASRWRRDGKCCLLDMAGLSHLLTHTADRMACVHLCVFALFFIIKMGNIFET